MFQGLGLGDWGQQQAAARRGLDGQTRVRVESDGRHPLACAFAVKVGMTKVGAPRGCPEILFPTGIYSFPFVFCTRRDRVWYSTAVVASAAAAAAAAFAASEAAKHSGKAGVSVVINMGDSALSAGGGLSKREPLTPRASERPSRTSTEIFGSGMGLGTSI